MKKKNQLKEVAQIVKKSKPTKTIKKCKKKNPLLPHLVKVNADQIMIEKINTQIEVLCLQICKSLDQTENEITSQVKLYFQGIRQKLQEPLNMVEGLVQTTKNSKNQSKLQILHQAQEFQKIATMYQDQDPIQKSTSNRGQPIISNKNLMIDTYLGGNTRQQLLKQCKQKQQQQSQIPLIRSQNLLIEKDVIKQQLESILVNNVLFNRDENIIQSSSQGQVKYLHWFEWGKRRLLLHNLVENISHVVELNTHFKIASFSRSILYSQTCQIFLFGGEEPEFHARKDAYAFDLDSFEKKGLVKLTTIRKLPEKRFDFTLTELNGWIYIISGKNGENQLVNGCHRYNPLTNLYEQIQPINQARYAASAAAIWPKIYIFGGRGLDNDMVSQIEIFNQLDDKWISLLMTVPLSLYVPAEVCGCIAISTTKILIFGGCNISIKEQDSTHIFDITTETYLFPQKRFEKKDNMKFSQVFVTPPFLYGVNVYAIGNEYYLKQRFLHKYNIKDNEWKLLA